MKRWCIAVIYSYQSV